MSDRRHTVFMSLLLGVTVLVILAAKVAHAHLVYGDWTCAFSHCIKVIPPSP